MLLDMFSIDTLNFPIAIFIAVFTVLIFSYSLPYLAGKSYREKYYIYIFLTMLAGLAAVFANNLIVLLVAWGFLGFTLYMLINMSQDNKAVTTAKKTFIIIGATDSLMILGLAIVAHLKGIDSIVKAGGMTFASLVQAPIALNTPLAIIAFLCFAAAAFAKAGAMPFHSWIPDCAETADIPVTAFLPASLDKLLGIYLLVRIWKDVFIPSQAMMLVLMIAGGFTIIAAVMMALIQHDLKKLLGYHAVSQVGYMILGIGAANPLGIAGGIFHMINHAIYKSCLFLGAGAVEQKTQVSDLDKMGGLAKFMPLTFICCLIASMSISGIPPFNGFASKWMIYQGVVERMSLAQVHPGTKIIMFFCLLAAMFGSALTLASFIKLLHAAFLGQTRLELKKIKISEVSPLMWMPMAILAVLCLVFGIFAYSIPLKIFIQPMFIESLKFVGVWQPILATWLVIIGIVLGFIVYLFGNILKSVREDKNYIGGETLPDSESLSGTEFYQTIREQCCLDKIYKKAEEKKFDIYEQGTIGTFFISKKLQELHSGLLPVYLLWCLLGMVVLYFVLGK